MYQRRAVSVEKKSRKVNLHVWFLKKTCWPVLFLFLAIYMSVKHTLLLPIRIALAPITAVRAVPVCTCLTDTVFKETKSDSIIRLSHSVWSTCKSLVTRVYTAHGYEYSNIAWTYVCVYRCAADMTTSPSASCNTMRIDRLVRTIPHLCLTCEKAEVWTDRLSRLLEGIRPAQATLLGSFLACHHRASVWSTISRTSPFLKLTPASVQGMVGSCWGL